MSLKKKVGATKMQYDETRITRHAHQRMGQRGISRKMLDVVLTYGTPCHDCKVTLGYKEVQDLISEMQENIKVLKKILDKGGVVVVADNNSVITTYNYEA
jgi:hypothetical protein